MVTPKIDHRAMKRYPKPDELITAMAVSPVKINRKTTIVTDDGEEIEVTIPERCIISHSDIRRILG
ncbi:hypothetical protein DPMN_097608 [Dreissena polymorpha]|uniref:Uncharacterized protein n=1 Tax=Dreissena polymorpha TaxID=45954 RepID=A0A9D4LC38_DREPO|nr:hypothetical protein DPMN_097608 [Dreissena polymorpha]